MRLDRHEKQPPYTLVKTEDEKTFEISTGYVDNITYGPNTARDFNIRFLEFPQNGNLNIKGLTADNKTMLQNLEIAFKEMNIAIREIQGGNHIINSPDLIDQDGYGILYVRRQYDTLNYRFSTYHLERIIWTIRLNEYVRGQSRLFFTDENKTSLISIKGFRFYKEPAFPGAPLMMDTVFSEEVRIRQKEMGFTFAWDLNETTAGNSDENPDIQDYQSEPVCVILSSNCYQTVVDYNANITLPKFMTSIAIHELGHAWGGANMLGSSGDANTNHANYCSGEGIGTCVFRYTGIGQTFTTRIFMEVQTDHRRYCEHHRVRMINQLRTHPY